MFTTVFEVGFFHGSVVLERSPFNRKLLILLQELKVLSKSDSPPVIASEDHATDEEKLASSVGSQKWTCMAVDLEQDKQDYPQPSDLTSFVNENQLHSSTDGIALRILLYTTPIHLTCKAFKNKVSKIRCYSKAL